MSKKLANIREHVKTLAQQIEGGYIELAVALDQVYTWLYWQNWGFSSFVDYVNRELQFGYRKAMYLVEIGECIRSLPLNPRRVRSIGWSKMKELVKVLTQENMEHLLKEAEKLSLRNLTDKVHSMRMAGIKAPGTLTYQVRRSEKRDLIHRVFKHLDNILEFRQLPLTVREDLAFETAEIIKVKSEQQNLDLVG